MTTFSICCWIALNIIITYASFVVVQWADYHLFTYLGEVEVAPGKWEMCFMYDTLTIPARIATFLIAFAAVGIAIFSWYLFIGLTFF